MIEERKRRIVVSSSGPAAKAAEAVDENLPFPDSGWGAESLVRAALSASLYVPVPAVIIGFAALIIFTFSLTVIITYWPASAPEIGENPRVREVEAVLEPVSRLPAVARNNRLAEALNIPSAMPKPESLTAALGLDSPIATLELSGRAEPLIHKASAGQRKLMFRRYAKAAPDPMLREEPEVSVAVLTPEIRPAAPLNLEPSAGEEADKPWQRYAAAIPADAVGKPKIVIVIDDMGNSLGMTEALSSLKAPLNFAFLPYAPSLQSQTSLARSHGHELLVHLPMEPEGGETPGPHALYSGLSDAELRRSLEWNLTRFDAYVGVNNHMGSHLTADSRVMEIVLGELKARGLLFLDSMTTRETVGPTLSRAKGLPWAERDVFLDNVPEDAAIQAQLMQMERIARTRGLAIAIGHPHRATLRALEDWLPTLEGKGLALVPLSAVVNFEGKTRLAIRAPAAGLD